MAWAGVKLHDCHDWTNFLSLASLWVVSGPVAAAPPAVTRLAGTFYAASLLRQSSNKSSTSQRIGMRQLLPGKFCRLLGGNVAGVPCACLEIEINIPAS
jgi:hypothetical protein